MNSFPTLFDFVLPSSVNFCTVTTAEPLYLEDSATAAPLAAGFSILQDAHETYKSLDAM